MRQVFWRADRLPRPETALPVDALIPEAGWCDDPASPFYNLPVLLPFAMGHEKLWRDDSVYDLIVVLGYNDAPPSPARAAPSSCISPARIIRLPRGAWPARSDDLLALLKAAKPGDALEIVR